MRPSRLLAVFMSLVVVSCALLMFAPVDSDSHVARISATGPKIVSGHVYAADGSTPIVGATVVVTVFQGFTLRGTETVTSDSTGFYSVTFAPSQWDAGDLIVVGVTYGSDVGGGDILADGAYDQTINVVLGTVIPEFDLPVILVAGVLGVVVVMARRAPTHKRH